MGEIAKFLVSDDPYKDDISIDTLDYDLALLKTNKSWKMTRFLLQKQHLSIIIFIRVDLLNMIKL